MKVKNETKVSNALRQLADSELANAGWSAGEIREVRKYLTKGASNAHQRRLVLRYQTLRRELVAAEAAAAAKAAKWAERYVSTVYSLAELDQIPDPAVREAALKLAALWEHTDGAVVPFPGITAGVDLHDREHKTNYYLRGEMLPADLPPMFSTAGRLTQRIEKAFPDMDRSVYQYPYCVVTLRTALTRALHGKDLFAWGEVR